MEEGIELKNVWFKYDGLNNEYVLKNINFKVNKGEFVCIVGANGSGKSTLSKLMNGIYELNNGEILIDSMSVKDESKILEIRKRLSIVFQNPDNQIVSSIVLDDVVFGPENILKDRDEITKRINEALENVGMINYKDHNTDMLSGGQKQRISIAGVLAMKPKYIIFDESTSMLDPSGKKEILDIIIKLNKDLGITLIVITHFIDECILADKLIILNNGSITYDGNPKNILGNEEFLKENSIETTFACSIYESLRKNFSLEDRNIFIMEELVDLICQLNLNK